MIDLSKYDGYTHDGRANGRLMIDAPILLYEVKRQREEVERLRADLAEAVAALEFAVDDLGRVTMADTIRAVLAKHGGAR